MAIMDAGGGGGNGIIYIDPNLHLTPWNDNNTVVTNVFGDSAGTYDPNTGTWSAPNDQKAYDRFAQLNPPLTPPKISLPNLSNVGNYLQLGVAAFIVIAIISLFRR